MKQTLIHDDRLRQQIDFLIEIDRLKHVLRRAYLPGTDRNENTAEHSWHLAVAVLVLPTDYGVLCLAFALYGSTQLFVGIYGLITLATVGFLCLALPKWFRDVRALGSTQ